MMKQRKYRNASSWLVYLFLSIGFHTTIAGWVYAQGVSFVTARKFSAGSDPVSVGVGDFNGDGNRDLAVANSGSNNVSVLLGKGDGTLQTAVNFPVGGFPNSVVVSHFNGDSTQDLAVESSDSSGSATVSILLGNGNGTFQPAMSFPAGAVGLPLTPGDFNNDTFQDVVIGSTSPFTMGVVLLGNGDGTLRPPLNAPIGGSSMVARDFNNDGILDIADVASIFNRIRVHIGNGDGTFRSPLFSNVVRGPRTLESGHFNGDVIADLVVADVDSGDVSILLGNGDGTFRPGGFSGLLLPGPFAVDDFNGDTIADLAHGAHGGIGVALGRGDGSFRPPAISTAPSGSFFAAGEFNSDGHKDLAVTGDGGVSILLGYGDGTFQGSWNYDLETGSKPLNTFLRPTGALGEFNRDGIQDLAVAIPARPDKISMLLGNGDGSFRWGTEFEAPGASSLAVGEFNGDGIQDLVAASSGSITLLLGNGNGTFQPAANLGIVDGPFVVGYLNGDVFQDLVMLSQSMSRVSVFLGNGNGTFRTPMLFETGAPVHSPEIRSVALGDFNSDGSQDLVATNGSAASISVLLGNGDGTFRAPLIVGAGGGPVSIVVGDFNSDHIQDLAVTGSFPGTSLLLGNGNGTFGMPTTIGMIGGNGLIGEAIASGDFNSDGLQDLAVTGSLSSRTSVLLGNGNGTFQPAANFLTTGGSSMVVGNLNSDSRPDIAVVGYDEAFSFRFNTLSVLINNTNTPEPSTADLELRKQDSPDPVTIGQNLTYTLTITNHGPVAAANVVVSDNLPVSTTFVSCFANQGGVCGGTGNNRTITFASLAPNAAATITIMARVLCNVSNGTLISSTAGVTSATPDRNPLNNSATAPTTASNPPPVVTSTVTAASLWPPNHDLFNVGLTASATDNCPGLFSFQVFVFSDEDDQTAGAAHSPDATDIAVATLRLRSEREEGSDGRVYLIVVQTTDPGGRVGFSVNTVVVPKSQSQANINAVNNQATAARSFALANGGKPPAGYFVIGDGPVSGSKK